LTKDERYNRSEKGRARYARYRRTEKGHANERRVHLAYVTQRRTEQIARLRELMTR